MSHDDHASLKTLIYCYEIVGLNIITTEFPFEYFIHDQSKQATTLFNISLLHALQNPPCLRCQYKKNLIFRLERSEP